MILQRQRALAQQGPPYSREFFQDYPKALHWRWHNAALKWFREVMIRDGRADLDLVATNTELPMTKHTFNEQFEFDHNTTFMWSWLEMIAKLDDASRAYVVGDGLEACRVLDAVTWTE